MVCNTTVQVIVKHQLSNSLHKTTLVQYRISEERNEVRLVFL